MATKAVYDGPGVYDEPYALNEARIAFFNAVRLAKTKTARLGVIDGFVAALQEYRDRVENDEETDEELFGPGHTTLRDGPATTIPPERP